MVTFADLEKILKWTQKAGAKVRIFFNKYPYILAIDRYIHAETLDGRSIEWIRAFGSKTPPQVLSTFRITRIEIARGDQVERVSSLNELLRRAV